MPLALTDEQAMLAAAARSFFAEQQPVKALRVLRDSNDAVGFDRGLWRTMAGLGWAGVLIPEAHGGSAFGYQGLGQIMEAAGRTLAASPLVATVLLGAPLVQAAGNDAQRAGLLPAVAAGELLLALALEEGPHHAPAGTAMPATRDGATWVLDGAKEFVLDGHVADQLLVVARTAGAAGETAGLTLFLVPGESPGLTRRRLQMVDSRNAARVRFDRVRVPSTHVLGPVGGGHAVLEAVLDGACAALAAEMLGSMQEAFDRTLAYLTMRVQFGVPIGSFQALKHRAAEMFCEIELTRSAVRAALDAQDAGDPARAALASLAKAKACDTFERVSNEAVQMHGGIGMTDAEEIGLFLKRARVAQQTLGDARFHRDRYARLRGF